MARIRPQITIPGCGIVQGTHPESQPSVAKFLNIPYATVPERWREAVKAEPWQGIRDGSVQGPVCHQPASENPLVNMASAGVDENDEEEYNKVFNERDCLNLNIFAPSSHLAQQGNKSKAPIPVMVWIHGGGYRDGSNAMDLYDATNLVAYAETKLGRPVIVITINYRLNFFGFLSSVELVEDIQSDPRVQNKTVGNWGLLDQKLALEWVRDHVHAFGGNPKDVTVFGESAGAASIGYHIGIPAHHGLFQKAILQSGAATTMIAGRPQLEGQGYFNSLCKYFGLNDQGLSGAEKLERLRAIPAKDLVKAGDKGRVGMFIPTIDNVVIDRDVRSWIHEPARYDPGVRAVMLGDCRDEGSMFVPMLGARSLKHWPRFMARNCPPGMEPEFEAIYGLPKTNADASKISARVLSDSVFLYPIHAMSLALLRPASKDQEASEREMVRFHFDRPLQVVEEMNMKLGAHHAVDLPFVFGSETYLDFLSEDEKQLSERVMAIWVLFAWGETSKEHGLRYGAEGSLLPADVGVGGAKLEAVTFTEQCTVEKRLVERLDERTLRFWRTVEIWQQKKREELSRRRLVEKKNKEVRSKL
ncbi:hypothetical protein BGZ94_010251 [Podila epigama]|nr:hypothetical protein BGZ94_010251 [Podila epigama]